MAVTDNYDFWNLDPDEEISDFPSTWNWNIDKIDTAIHDAATGNVSLSRIPNLPAGKTTTGAFADARIPSTIARSADVAGDISDGDAATLSAAKAYTDDAATSPVSLSRLPNLPASKTTSGTFADARIPASIARVTDVETDTTALERRIKELEDAQPYFSGLRELALPANFIGGRVLISRYRNEVTLRFEQVEITGLDESTNYEYLTDGYFIPNGFRPKEYTDRPIGLFGGSYANYSGYIGVFQQSRLLYFRSLDAPLSPGPGRASGELRWTASDALPTSLPGVPA